MATRNIYKQLAGMQDIAQGVGEVEQLRNNQYVKVNKIDVPFAVESEAELKALDITKYNRARVYDSAAVYTDYVYSESVLTGIQPNEGVGSWIRAYNKASQTSFDVGSIEDLQNCISLQGVDFSDQLVAGFSIYLTDEVRYGSITWRVGDYSAKVANDTLNGLFIAKAGTDGSTGCWVRDLSGFVTPEMFGGGSAGFIASLASGYTVHSDLTTTYDLITSQSLTDNLYLQSVKLTGANAENLKFRSGDNNVKLRDIDIDCSSGIAIHHNAQSNDATIVTSKIGSTSYAFLSNDGASGSDGLLLALNYIRSDNSDAVELNHPSGGASHQSVLGNIIETDNTATTTSSGFGVGVAGTQGHITALNHVRLSRNESYHYEDEQKRGICLGNTGLTENHGVTLYPAASGESATGVITQANHITENTGTKTGKYGAWCIYNANGTLKYNIFNANYLKGFERGLDGGAGVQVAAANVFANVDYGIALSTGGKVFSENLIAGACTSLARLNNKTWCPKLAADTPITGDLINFVGSSGAAGAVLKGFNIPVNGVHTGGSTSMAMCVTPIKLNSETRLHGKICITNTTSNYSVYIADVVWDGTTLTKTNTVNKNGGGMTSCRVELGTGYMEIWAYSNTSISTQFTIDFDGYYYEEA